MPKVTANYETLFIVNATIGEEAIASVVEKFTTLVSQNGELTSVNEWGKRRLAYAIDDMTEGYYVLIEFNSKPEFPAELDRIFNITEEVMRSIIIAKE
ncbi:MAG: 30S ribosomal protein S6 [Clostridia bacterium]|nr:30S ribosomal protein S6 [Clostridia bacterium]